MKANIIMLPTEEYSPLVLDVKNDNLFLTTSFVPQLGHQNLYITSDEDEKKFDWFIFFSEYEPPSLHQYHSHAGYGIKTMTDFNEKDGSSLILSGSRCSGKIVITTDKKLIEKGIQAVNQEFLEYFIKNRPLTIEVEELMLPVPCFNGDEFTDVIHYNPVLAKEMTLEDYQKRDAHIVKYLNYMIRKAEKNLEDYRDPMDAVKRSAYKDILFKMTKNK